MVYALLVVAAAVVDYNSSGGVPLLGEPWTTALGYFGSAGAIVHGEDLD